MKQKKILLLATAVIFVGLLFGCKTDEDPVIEVKGDWELISAFTSETWSITESTISYDGGFGIFYKADIVSFDNETFNAGESDASDHGYAVIQYTAVDGAGTGEVGKYNVFRWKEFDGSTSDFSQGYKNVGDPYPNNVNGVSDSEAEAESDITEANGYFAVAFYSEDAVLQ